MRFCVANASAPPPCPKRSHSPLDRAFRSVTLASRDPISRFSRHGFCPRGDPRRVRPRSIDRRTEKEEGRRRNARRHFADAFRNAGTDREAEAGDSKIENEKESDANADTEAKSQTDRNARADEDSASEEENSSGR